MAAIARKPVEVSQDVIDDCLRTYYRERPTAARALAAHALGQFPTHVTAKAINGAVSLWLSPEQARHLADGLDRLPQKLGLCHNAATDLRAAADAADLD